MKHKCLRLAVSVGFVALLFGPSAAFAQIAPSLGAAQSFAVLGGSGVTNAGAVATVVNGDLGISPGLAAAITGPFTVTGSTYAGPLSLAGSAQTSRTTAYNDLFVQACNSTQGPGVIDIGGSSVTPGVYCFQSALEITGDLTLNAQGNPNAVFIFKTGTAGASTLTTAGGARVLLTNGAQACNVFWAVSSSATIGATNTFVGNILAQVTINVGNASHLFGRVLAQTAVNLQNDIIDATVCAAVAGGSPPVACPTGTTPPVITTIPSQVIPTLPVGGSVAVGFTIGGSIITNALTVTATSSNPVLVPPSAMVITAGAGGARVLTIFGADGRSGVATITVTVVDPSVPGCALTTSTSFLLTIGTAVPTLPQWAMIALAVFMALAGFAAIRRRQRI